MLKFTSNPILLNNPALDINWIHIRDLEGNRIKVENYISPNQVFIDESHIGKILLVDVTPTTLFDGSSYNDNVEKLIAIYRENISKEKDTSFYEFMTEDIPDPRDVTGITDDYETIGVNYYVGSVSDLDDIRYSTKYNPPGKTIVRANDFTSIWAGINNIVDVLGLFDGRQVINANSVEDFFTGRIFYFNLSDNLNYRFLPIKAV